MGYHVIILADGLAGGNRKSHPVTTIDYAVILATGSPAHQSQLTYNRSRAMLPALGKPLVVRVMDRLYRTTAIRRYVVVVGADEGAITAYLQAHWMANTQVDFILQPAGVSLGVTLGTIARRYRNPFMLTTYSSFTHPNLPYHLLERAANPATDVIMTGAQTSLAHRRRRYSLLNGQPILSVAMPANGAANGAELVPADLLTCGQPFVDYLADGAGEPEPAYQRDLLALLGLYLENGGQADVAQAAWGLSIETDPDLLALNRVLLDEEQDAHILSELPGTVQVIPPVRIDPRVSIGRGATIGPYVYLETGCSIGTEAVVANAIVMQKATVAPRSHIANAIIATRAHIQV